MRLNTSKWTDWDAAGVRVQAFDAEIVGSEVVARMDRHQILSVPMPSRAHPWMESLPLERDGRSYLLAASYQSPWAVDCHLFRDGRSLESGRGLDSVRTRPRASLLGISKVPRAIVVGAPFLGTSGMARALGANLSAERIPAATLAILAFLGVSIAASRVGVIALGRIEGRGTDVGRRGGLVAILTIAVCGLAMALILLGPARPWLLPNP
jgi:hypothetical protein